MRTPSRELLSRAALGVAAAIPVFVASDTATPPAHPTLPVSARQAVAQPTLSQSLPSGHRLIVAGMTHQVVAAEELSVVLARYQSNTGAPVSLADVKALNPALSAGPLAAGTRLVLPHGTTPVARAEPRIAAAASAPAASAPAVAASAPAEVASAPASAASASAKATTAHQPALAKRAVFVRATPTATAASAAAPKQSAARRAAAAATRAPSATAASAPGIADVEPQTTAAADAPEQKREQAPKVVDAPVVTAPVEAAPPDRSAFKFPPIAEGATLQVNGSFKQGIVPVRFGGHAVVQTSSSRALALTIQAGALGIVKNFSVSLKQQGDSNNVQFSGGDGESTQSGIVTVVTSTEQGAVFRNSDGEELRLTINGKKMTLVYDGKTIVFTLP